MLDKENFALVENAARELAFCASAGEVWKKLVDLAGAHMKCEAGSYFSADAEKQMLTLEHAFGDFAEDISHLAFGWQGIVGRCARTRAAVLDNSVRENPEFCAKVDSATGFVTKNVLAVPVFGKGGLCGVLEFMNRSFYNGGEFSAADRDTLEVLALLGAKTADGLPA